MTSYKMMKTLLAFTLILFGNLSFGQDTKFSERICEQGLESLPIQQGGRVKPLYVHAAEVIKHLTGSSKVDGISAVQAYCRLSFEGQGLASGLDFKGHVEHYQVRSFLGFADSEKIVSYEKLIPKMDLISAEWRSTTDDGSYKKSLNTLFAKIHLYKEIKDGNNWVLAESLGAGEIAWVPFINYLNERKVIESREKGISDPFLPILRQSQTNYIAANGDKYLVELTYAKMRLPLVTFIINIIAIASMVLTRKFMITIGLSALTLAIQTAYIILRIYISERAPVTNMYETVLVSGYGALFLAMIIGHYRNEKNYVFGGLIYNLLSLMMINFAGGMVSGSIGPLVPVLRDNFWLSTHVTTIILSYGALALSWILANMVLIKVTLKKMDEKEIPYYCDIIYTCLKYGNILLFFGIVLGGIWADYSWGRFWGWDPKETWSLIVFCLYMAILHGKYTKWISPKRFIPLTALAFLSVMMAWFGVNYILAAGLHSYGFSEGGAVFLGTFFAVQIIIVALTGKDFFFPKNK